MVEWFGEEYVRAISLKSHIKRKVGTTQFQDQFDIMKVEVGGIDFSVWRIVMKAKRNCACEYKFYDELKIGVRVASENITNEVKRLEFLIDMGRDVELRGGDTLVLYVSMGGYEK